MYHPISLFIGLRYLWNASLPKFKKLIIILSIISISFSVASLIIVISIINGFENNFKKNTLSFIPHMIITNKNQYVNKTEYPKDILKLNNVKKISDMINKEVIVQSKNNTTTAEILGIDATNYENVRNYNLKNILEKLSSKQYNAIIGKKLAEKIGVKIGDKIKLILLSGKLDFFNKTSFNQHTFKVISFFSTQNEIDYYQILINKKESLKFLNYSKNYVTGWRVWLKKPISSDINKIKNTIKHLVVLDWKTQKGELFKTMTIEKYLMLFLFFLIFIVSIVNLFINISVYTIEKKNNVAILKSQGLLDWKIIWIFVILGASIAIIGSVLGTVISVLLILKNNFLNNLINIFFNHVDIPILVIPSQIFFINIISIFLTAFSTLYPAWNAMKTTPAKILSNE